MYYISPFSFIPNGSRVFPLSMRYASLAFRTLSQKNNFSDVNSCSYETSDNEYTQFKPCVF